MSRPRRRAMLGVARVLVTLALVLGLLPVYAQQPDPGQVAVDEGLVFRASRLTGAEVLNQDGQTLGEVEGFLVRWAPADQAAAGAQQVAYVLVGAENLVAVPAELFSFDARDQTFRLEISELELTEAPGLQLSPDAEWEQGLFDYWSGLGSALEQPPSEANLVRAGHLDGSPIVSEDQEVGVVEDLLIQLAPAESAASPEPGLTGTPEGEETPTVTGTPETEVTPEAAQTPEVTGTPAPEGTPQATPAAEVEPSKEAVAAGRLVAQSSGCLGCHSTDGTTRVGPTWQDLYGSKENLEDGTTVEVDTEYLRRSILDPDAQIVRGFPSGIMPHTYDLQLSEEDINNVIAYIMSLSQVPVGQEPEATEAAPEETEEPTAVPEEVEEATPGAELTPEAKPTAPDEPIALRVVYVVASLSPDLGADSQRVVLPAGLLDYERDQRQFRLRQGVDMLPDAPAFNPAELRGGAPADWDDPISEFWAGLPASVPVTPESTPSAGTTPAPDVTETPAPKEAETGIVSLVSRLVGAPVFDQDGNDIGDLQDLIAQFSLGQEEQPGAVIQAADVRYALVTFGGMEGLPGGGPVAVPMGALRPAPELGPVAMLFTGDVNQLQDVPAFPEDLLPQVSDPGWDTALADFWRGMGYDLPEAGESIRAYRVSTLANYDVANFAGQDRGDVDDMIVEIVGGQASLRYALVGFGGFLGIGQTMVAVPLNLMRMDPDPERTVLYVDAPPEQLQTAPTFVEEDIPEQFDPNWDNRWERFWAGAATPEPGATPQGG